MKAKPKKKVKFPMSKSMIVLVWSQVLATLVTVVAIVLCIITMDVTPICYLIPAVFVDASAVTALVLWKRKSENVLMYLMDEKLQGAIEWLNQNGIDVADFFRAIKE